MEHTSAVRDSSEAPLNQILAATRPGVVAYCCEEYYREEAPILPLLAVHVPDGKAHRVVVTDRIAVAQAWLAEHDLNTVTLDELAATVAAPVIDLLAPWRLQPVSVAKPWGQEIWYTGIEKRGQSRVGEPSDSVPLPWLLALSPDGLLLPGIREPALLKILDPLPEAVFGDLYFELHEEKREVYVVTHVDAAAWPDGEGAIRFGFDQVLRSQFASDDDFREAFRCAVRAYEKVRRAIDGHCDQARQKEGVGLNEPVDAATLKRWLATVPGDLAVQERSAREAMNRFTHMLPLKVGDVVKVPCLTPHALQHGVRTVEFQTPVYERQIVSFAQKVLTQGHWDTDRAVAIMDLGAGTPGSLDHLDRDDNHTLERVVRFSDFEVLRLTLVAGGRWTLMPTDHYALLMVVEGSPVVAGLPCESEDALLVPRGAPSPTIAAEQGSGAVVLVCLPVTYSPA